MERKKLLALVGSGCLMLILVVLPFMGACAKPAVEEPIKIGVDLELTGIMSETSTNIKKGYDLFLNG